MVITERQSALTDVIKAINSTLELDEVLRIVMDNIIRLMKAERGFLMLRDETGELVTHIARNWEQEALDPSEFAVSRTIIQRVVSEGEPVLTTNAQEDPRFGSQESIIIFNLRSILCVPLKVKGELTGVIYVDNRIHAGIFSDAERDLLTAFANHAGVALENARLFDSVRRTLAEVTELKNLMGNVLASIASGVITADNNHCILLSNRAAQNILGQLNQSMIGQTLEQVLALADGSSATKEILQAVETIQKTDQQVIGREYTLVSPSRGSLSLSLNLITAQGCHIIHPGSCDCGGRPDREETPGSPAQTFRADGFSRSDRPAGSKPAAAGR